MVAISDKRIQKLCEGDNPLISDAPNFDEQLQPAGFDLTVKSITRQSGSGQVGGPYRSKVADEEEVKVAEDGFYSLSPGAYLIYVNEFTRIPRELTGLALPRSTLFRCGGILATGVWDGGFNGRGRLGLFVMGVEELRIEQNSPIAQIVFHEAPGVEIGFQFNEFYKES